MGPILPPFPNPHTGTMWEGGWTRDGCGDCPFGEAGLMRDEFVDFP